MSNNDYMKWVTSDVDFYELLGLQFENFSENELRKQHRKTALKYHPDKLGKDYDPEKYELFQAAGIVLGDAELKAKYDNARNAKLQKQRANELFEGKRRQMKEDLEARERGGVLNPGVKRQMGETSVQQEIRKLAEEGRKRKAARRSMMDDSIKAQMSSPAPEKRAASPVKMPAPAREEPAEEDEVERLERLIREKEEAKAKKKADRKARKSGIFVPADSPSVGGFVGVDRDTSTPIKRPDIFRGLKADEKSSASPKFSFSPNSGTPRSNDFAATMARLKAAEEKRQLEEEIRQQEAAEAN